MNKKEALWGRFCFLMCVLNNALIFGLCVGPCTMFCSTWTSCIVLRCEWRDTGLFHGWTPRGLFFTGGSRLPAYTKLSSTHTTGIVFANSRLHACWTRRILCETSLTFCVTIGCDSCRTSDRIAWNHLPSAAPDPRLDLPGSLL